MIKVSKDLLSASHVPGGALQLYRVRLQVNVDVESALHHLQVFVADAKQLLDIRDDFYIFLHSVFWGNPLMAQCSPDSVLAHREHKIALCMETQDRWPTGTRR